METLTLINTVIVTLFSLFSLLALLCKPFRRWILGYKKAKEEEAKRESERIETDKCLLRDRILSIYYKNNKECEIRQYDYENLAYMYKQYKKLGGNSFVDRIWEEIKDWKIIK